MNPHVLCDTDPKASRHPCTHAGCGKVLATSFSLRRHIDLKHKKNKNHSWNYWGKKFSLNQYLKEHILIHTKETPFICNINGCTAAFRQRAKLCAHRKTHKLEKNQKQLFMPMHDYSKFTPVVKQNIILPPVTLSNITSGIHNIQDINFDFSQYTIPNFNFENNFFHYIQ